VLIAAAVAAAVLYGRTLHFGFDWDDYHFVRSYAPSDVAAAYTGTWDPRGIEAPFYRPATIALFATRGWILSSLPPEGGSHAKPVAPSSLPPEGGSHADALGAAGGSHPDAVAPEGGSHADAVAPEGGSDANAVALHALSLVMLVAAAAACAWWLRSLELRASAVLLGTIAFVAHPMIAPAAAWITNQMHLLQLIAVAAAMALTSRVRWYWLIPLQAAALLIKEDSLVLPVAMAACWWAQRRPVPRGWIAASAVLTLLYVAVRTWALHGFGGYEPGAAEMLRNAGRAPFYALLVFPFNGGVWLVVPIVVMLVHALRRSAGDRRLFLMAILFFVFDAPLAFSSGPTRWHLLVLPVAGALAVSSDALRTTRWALPLGAMLVAGFAAAGWTVTNRWKPCSPEVRLHDARAATWGEAVDPALRLELRAKARTCGK